MHFKQKQFIYINFIKQNIIYTHALIAVTKLNQNLVIRKL